MRGPVAKAAVQSALTFKLYELSSSLVSYYSLAFLRGFGTALEKGRALFLLTTSISPPLQAYTELHALSPLRGSISPCCHHGTDVTHGTTVTHVTTWNYCHTCHYCHTWNYCYRGREYGGQQSEEWDTEDGNGVDSTQRNGHGIQKNERGGEPSEELDTEDGNGVDSTQRNGHGIQKNERGGEPSEELDTEDGNGHSKEWDTEI